MAPFPQPLILPVNMAYEEHQPNGKRPRVTLACQRCKSRKQK